MIIKKIKNILVKSKITFIGIWEIFKMEGVETKIAFIIITKIIQNKNVTNGEILFLKAHSKDLIKMLPIIAIQGIPLPIPFTLIFILISKKYNIDILPKDNRGLLEKKIIKKNEENNNNLICNTNN
jgi:hypothetical protein